MAFLESVSPAPERRVCVRVRIIIKFTITVSAGVRAMDWVRVSCWLRFRTVSYTHLTLPTKRIV